jgi:hypothetical protein
MKAVDVVTAEVGPGTQVTGFPTNRELAACPLLFDCFQDNLRINYYAREGKPISRPASAPPIVVSLPKLSFRPRGWSQRV